MHNHYLAGAAWPSPDNMPVTFKYELCDVNPYCPVTRVCPTKALFVDEKTFRPVFDPVRCSGCAICVSSCPRGALHED